MNSVTVQWQTNVTNSHIFSQYTAKTLIKTHAPKFYSYKLLSTHSWDLCIKKRSWNIITVSFIGLCPSFYLSCSLICDSNYR